MKTLNKFVVYAMVAMITLMSVPAHADMVGTGQMLSQTAQAHDRATVDTFMARADVGKQFLAWGVAPGDVKARVDALSQADVQKLANSIGSEPAGGDGLIEVMGIILIVFLILELTGVTNIFTAF